jgi:glycosyltransferase involved in cell wall biosynthesis
MITLHYQNIDKKQSYEVFYDKLQKNVPEVFNFSPYNEWVIVTLANDVKDISKYINSGKKVILRAPHISNDTIPFITYALNVAEGIIFQSDFMKQLYLNYFGDTGLPSCVIHNAVDMPEDDIFRHNNDKILIMGDFLYHEDRHPFQVNKQGSLLQVLNWLCDKYDITVAGTISEMNIPDSVHIINGGTRFLDLNQIRQDHGGIYIHTVLFDNCPNCLLESMAFGMPCIGFNSGSVPELLPEELISQFNQESLINTITEVNSDGFKGSYCKTIAERFNFQNYTDSILKFIQSL